MLRGGEQAGQHYGGRRAQLGTGTGMEGSNAGRNGRIEEIALLGPHGKVQ